MCNLMWNGLIILLSEATLELSCSTAISLFAFALQKHEEGLMDGRFIESDDPWILDPTKNVTDISNLIPGPYVNAI